MDFAPVLLMCSRTVGTANWTTFNYIMYYLYYEISRNSKYIYIISNCIWQDGLGSHIVDMLTNTRYGEPDYF